jgi:hypothetical protein
VKNKKLISMLIASAALGIAGNILIRGGGLGLNALLWFIGLGAAIHLIKPNAGRSRSFDDPLVLLLVLFGGTCVWRDSAALKFLCLVSAGLLAVAYSLRSKGFGPKLVLLHQTVAESVLIGLSFAFRPFYIFFNENLGEHRYTVERFRTPLLVLRGVALSMPLLLIFGLLFSSADERFGNFLGKLFLFDIKQVWSHVLLTGFFFWVSLGFIHRLVEEKAEGVLTNARQLVHLGGVEMITALALLDALFALFVCFQLPYFFGGMSFLLPQESLTLAQYYRHGFFELMVVVAGTIPILLFSRWGLREVSDSERRRVQLFAGFLLCLVVCIVGSVFHKFFLYEQVFGLTELRLYTFTFLLWLVVVLVLVGRVMLRRTDYIVFPAGAAILSFVVFLCIVNPDGLIVRVNAGRDVAKEMRDGSYLAKLSADAVPIVLDHFDQFKPDDQAYLARTYLAQWAVPPADIRAWSFSRVRAAEAVALHRERLISLVAASSRKEQESRTTGEK